MWQSLLQDVRYGWRLLWRSPGFSVAAVATLALGIGANSAIFSIVNVLSLKPLSYHDPERVAFVLGWDVERAEMRFNLRQADFVDLQRRATSLESIAGYSYLSANLTGGDIPERVQAYRVTPNTFALLGVPAALGRAFDEGDARASAADAEVISHGLWQRRFGGEPNIIGRPIVVNGEPYEIIGVMPARFEYPVFNFKGDLWLPWTIRDGARGQAGATSSITVVGRVRRDVSYAQAQAELDTLMRAFAIESPATNRGLGVRLIEMGRLDDEEAGPAIMIVLATVALVLVLSCVNVANLLLSRNVSRQREIAVRTAIGASASRISRQLLVESLLLSLIAGIAGVLLAFGALRVVRTSLPETLLTTMPNVDALDVDVTTLGFTLLLSIATSLVFGLLPAWRASHLGVRDGLQQATAGHGRGARRLRSTLVTAEVALSTVLLITAGLLVRSYAGLQRVHPGFDPSGVLTLALTLPDYKYGEPERRRQFFEQAVERIVRLPGVSSAAFVNVLPFSTYDRGTRLRIDGAPAAEASPEIAVAYRVASPRYHETMRIPLVEGRALDERDTATAARVALVNQSLARRLFDGASPVGRMVRLGAAADAPSLTIVGVIGDVYHATLTDAPVPEVHVPLAQAPPSMMMLAVRTPVRPQELVGAVRGEILAIDPFQAVYHVRTLEALVGDSLLPRSTTATLMLLCAAVALALATIGIYGVVAYSVSQQTREFGVRMALGATRAQVVGVVLRHGSLMIFVGVVLGVAGAFGVTRLLASVLYGISPADPPTYAIVVALLAIAGFLACLVPARRASSIDPYRALRMD